MNEPQTNRKKIWFWVAGIIIVGLVSLILVIVLKNKKLAELPPQINTPAPTGSPEQISTTTETGNTQIQAQANTSTQVNAPIKTYTITQISTCDSFTYSEWSVCSRNGTQTRTVIKAEPENCHNGNPILSQNCVYKMIPPEANGLNNYQKMISQIKSAPNQTISANYKAGADSKNTTILTWQLKNNELYLYVKGYVTANPKEHSEMTQVDTNLDGKPDRIADNGLPFVAITPSHQYYKEILISWATFMAYFEKNLLK